MKPDVVIKINPEFERLMSPHTEEERAGLDLLSNGCRDPLKVWPQPDGTLIFLDGYNRYAICQRHRLDYRVEKVEWESGTEALRWICAN